jgi:pentatricopeptide repeat protein
MTAMTPGTTQLDVYSWNRRLSKYVKAGKYQRVMMLYQQMQHEGLRLSTFTFVPVLHVPIYEHLKMAGVFINRSFKVLVSLMCLWQLALLTCIPNVRAWRKHGKCSTRCPHAMWSLGMP